MSIFNRNEYFENQKKEDNFKDYLKNRDKSVEQGIETSKVDKEDENESEDEQEESSSSSGFGIGNITTLMGGFIALLIGVSLIGPISDAINVAVNSSVSNGSINQSSMLTEGSYGGTILKLVPAFFILTLFCIIIATVWNALRSAGVIGEGSGI